jgi:hypothetical protein
MSILFCEKFPKKASHKIRRLFISFLAFGTEIATASDVDQGEL